MIPEFNESSNYPEADVSDADNYCRNPDRRFGTGPFCVFEGNKTETCGIPLCRSILGFISYEFQF